MAPRITRIFRINIRVIRGLFKFKLFRQPARDILHVCFCISASLRVFQNCGAAWFSHKRRTAAPWIEVEIREMMEAGVDTALLRLFRSNATAMLKDRPVIALFPTATTRACSQELMWEESGPRV